MLLTSMANEYVGYSGEEPSSPGHSVAAVVGKGRRVYRRDFRNLRRALLSGKQISSNCVLRRKEPTYLIGISFSIYSSNPRSTPPLFSGTGLIFSIAQECVGVQAIHSGLPKNRGAARCLRRAIDSAVISSGFSVVVRRPDSVEPGITLCPRGRVGANASQRT